MAPGAKTPDAKFEALEGEMEAPRLKLKTLGAMLGTPGCKFEAQGANLEALGSTLDKACNLVLGAFNLVLRWKIYLFVIHHKYNLL